MENINFFAESDRIEKLKQMDNTLTRLEASLDWEMFRNPIKQAIRKEDQGLGGRPAYDEVLMFKILVLQRLYNLSDDQTEYQINDRLSFQRFLGLSLSSKVPDAKTIWLFREQLKEARAIDFLFMLFENSLEMRGLITHKGSLVDASFVEVPKRKDKPGEKDKINEGEFPEDWNVHTIRQKDTEARWTKKGDQSFFGYKNHVKVDEENKLVVDYTVTSANVHDSQELAKLSEPNDGGLYADSAYIGIPLPEGVEGKICERSKRGKPLTEEQKARNKAISKIRCRVEHVFGFIEIKMKGSTCRLIGKARAAFNIDLTNLVYNLCRAEFLCRKRLSVR